MTEADRALRAGCARWLSGHRPEAPAALLRRLAERPEAALPPDSYGEGGALAVLEARTAALLNKPAAAFFAKGMVAQMAALRLHADARGASAVAVPAQGHMALDEGDAVERVAGLRLVRLGGAEPFGAAALDGVADPLAAVVVELPLRRAAYRLPALAELRAVSGWCRARGVPLHLDGARLWEAAAAWGIAPAAVAALADTVYVSFYKGLGALGGAVLAGDPELVRASAAWRLRHGGTLATAWPLVLSALDGLDRRLPRMAAWHEAAAALATRLDGLLVNPRVPHANAFQLWLPGTPDELARRNRAFAERHVIWLFNGFAPAPLDGYALAELVVGDASDDWTADEAAGWVRAFAGATGTADAR